MRISQLIRKLVNIRSKYGDLSAYYDYDTQFQKIEEVRVKKPSWSKKIVLLIK